MWFAVLKKTQTTLRQLEKRSSTGWAPWAALPHASHTASLELLINTPNKALANGQEAWKWPTSPSQRENFLLMAETGSVWAWFTYLIKGAALACRAQLGCRMEREGKPWPCHATEAGEWPHWHRKAAQTLDRVLLWRTRLSLIASFCLMMLHLKKDVRKGKLPNESHPFSNLIFSWGWIWACSKATA